MGEKYMSGLVVAGNLDHDSAATFNKDLVFGDFVIAIEQE